MAKKVNEDGAGWNPKTMGNRKGSKPVPRVSTRSDGRKVHTYANGQRVVLPAKKKVAKVAAKPVDPYAVAAASATAEKYAPAEEQLASSQRAQSQRSQDVAGWYEAYKQQVAQATQANQAAAQAGQANLTALGTAVASNDRAGQAQIASQMQADAQARGATVDPNVGARMLEGSAVRGGNLASSQALQAFQALQQGTVDRQRGVAGEGLKVAALQSSAARSSDLERQSTQLQKEKGAFQVDYRDKLEADAQKQALEDFITRETLGIKKTTAAAQVASVQTTARDKEQRRIIARQSAKDTAADRATKNSIAAKRADKAGAKKSPFVNAAAQGKQAGKIDSALGYARTLKEQRISRHDAAQYLLNGQKAASQPVYTTDKSGKQVRVLNPDGTPKMQTTGRDIPKFADSTLAVSVALDVAYDGHVSKANVRRLHAAGIKVNSLGYPTKVPVKKQPTAAEKAAVAAAAAALKGMG